MELFEKQVQLPFVLPQKEGYRWDFDEKNKVFIVHIPNGKLLYATQFFDQKESDFFLDELLANDNHDWKNTNWKNVEPQKIQWKNVKWRLDAIRMFGKMIPQPRFTAWYGDEDKSYKYSGITMHPEPWNEVLLRIKNRIETLSETNFNSVLLNWYRDGLDHMSWHADNEPELGKNPIIASVNLGATRRFLLRKNEDNSEKIEIPLHHGTFLLMAGETQHFWKHALPKATKVQNTRINLTFRVIK